MFEECRMLVSVSSYRSIVVSNVCTLYQSNDTSIVSFESLWLSSPIPVLHGGGGGIEREPALVPLAQL